MDEEQKKEGENGTENFWEKGLEGEHHQSVPYIFMKCDNKDPSFHNSILEIKYYVISPFRAILTDT